MTKMILASVALACTALTPVMAADDGSLAALRQEIAKERADLDAQQRAINAQRDRLLALESNLVGRMQAAGITVEPMATASSQSTGRSTSQSTGVPLPASPPPAPPGPGGEAQAGVAPGIGTVGEAPTDQRQVQVAVLADQGGVITKAGRLTVEADLEYARADRNRTVFRGVEIPESVLIGVFDINESRQDVLTAATVARLGVSSRFEINGRVPFVYRSDKSVLAPVANPSSPNAGQVDGGVHSANLGDVDFGMRYQFTDGRNGYPYLIAGVQVIAPTGTNPFTVRRDTLGNALKAATGAGFWAVSPSITAILPTDPAVLFGSVGYTYNFGRSIGRAIGPTYIDRVKPGGEPSASVGIAISLNPRTSVSFGYAHTMSFGTKSRFRAIDTNGALGDEMDTQTRKLQLGRLLFGMSYRANAKTTINWNLEMGATDDATDIRTTLRIPFTFDIF